MKIQSWKEQYERMKGGIWNGLGGMMFGMSSLLLLVLVSRSCSLETTGVYSVSFATAQLMYLVGLFGAEHYQMTDYAQRYSFAAYRKLKWVSTGIALTGCVAACTVLGFNRETFLLTLLLTLYMQVHSFGSLYQSLLFKMERLDLDGKSRFLRTLAALVVFGVTIEITHNVFLSAAALTAVCLIALYPWPYCYARPYIKTASKNGMANMGSLFKECIPMFLVLFLSNLMLNLPRYMIEFFWNDAVQGIFGMLFMPAQVINMLSMFIYMPVLKPLSDVKEAHDTAGLYAILGKVVTLVTGFTFLCAAGAALLGPEVLGWLYGADLIEYRPVLVLVVVGGGLFAASQMFYFMLVVMRQLRKLLWIYVMGNVLCTLLSLVLVAKFSIVGAVSAFAASHLLLLLLMLAMLLWIWRRVPNA